MLDARIQGGWNPERGWWSHLVHWMEETDMKSPRAQRGASPLVKSFLLRGTGGKRASAQPPYRGAMAGIGYAEFPIYSPRCWRTSEKGNEKAVSWTLTGTGCRQPAWKREIKMKGEKIRGKQANKPSLLTLVSMSVTLLSPSSSTTFTTR